MTEQPLNTPPPPLRGALLLGSVWMLGVRWALRVLGAINIAIIARLLTPEDFGVVAMATAVVGLSKVFFELGVDFALIQKVDARTEHFNAAWSIRLLQAIALAATLLLIGPFVESYYNDPRVVPILGVLAFSVLVQGLTNIGVVSFRKDLNFHKEFHFLVWSKFLSVGATILLAFALRSYWALVIGILLGNFIQCVLSYLLHPFRPKISFAAAGDIWSFSKWMVVLQISDYLTLKFDRILIGGLVTPARLGHYTIGTELAQMATTELVSPVSRALVPGLAKLQSHPQRLRAAYLKTLAATALVTLPIASGLAIVAAELVPIALGDQWYDAISIVQISSINLMFATLASGAQNLSLVTGHIAKLVPLSISRAVIFLATFYPAFAWDGIHGVLYAKTLIAVLWLIFLFQLVCRTHEIKLSTMLAQIWRPAIGAAVMVVGTVSISSYFLLAPFALLAAKVALGASLYIATELFLWRAFGGKNDIESELLKLMTNKAQPVLSRFKK